MVLAYSNNKDKTKNESPASVLIKRHHAQQHVQSNFHRPLLFMLPFLPSLFPQRREGLPLCRFKAAKPSGAGWRSGSSRWGGSLRGCNYRLHSPVKTGPVDYHRTGQKNRRHSYPGSHSGTAGPGLYARYVGHEGTGKACLTR